MPRYSWPKGKSGNPKGRPVGIPNGHAQEWFKRLLVAIHRTAKIGQDGKPILEVRKAGEEVDLLTLVADKVLELAMHGNAWAIEHLASRLDGKVKEQLDINYTADMKVRFESYEEARVALLEQGIDVRNLPMLTDMRPPVGRDRS
jgi:hypothetical protein